jgi:DNA invertase Pin-like site-specific DNA recombinase
MKTIVGYVRVSTKRQQRKGWGIKAQEQAIKRYARSHKARIRKIYVEQESGDSEDRPDLALAIAHAKRSRCRLVVAKIDRLVRSYSLLRELEQAKVKFVACDYPAANKLTVHILCAVAEHELELIRKRVKAGLQAAKRGGVKLGNPSHLADWKVEHPIKARQAQRKGADANRAKAVDMYASLLPRMQQWRESMTLQQIADRLNSEGETTQRRKPWTATAVMRAMAR